MTVTPVVSEPIEGFICVADATDGSVVVGRTINSTTQDLPLSRSVAAWNITCRGNSETLQYRGSTSFAVPVAERATLAVELKPSGTFFKPVSVIVPPTAPVILVGPDSATRLEVPADSFPVGSTVKFTMKSGTGFTESSSFSPLSAFDFKITVDDIPTTIVEKPITIAFPIDDALLDQFGALPEDLYPARFDEISQIWVRENSFFYDKESKAIRVAVTHFSIWGLLVDLLKTLTNEIPSNIKIKAPAKKSTKGWKRAQLRSVSISWEVSDSEIGPYQAQFLRVRRRVKAGEPYIVPTDWTKARTYTAEENRLTVHRPAGIYIFRVKIATSVNYSEARRFTVR